MTEVTVNKKLSIAISAARALLHILEREEMCANDDMDIDKPAIRDALQKAVNSCGRVTDYSER